MMRGNEMHCYICDTTENLQEDKKTKKIICETCNDVVLDTISEFDTEKCTDVWKREHGIE